MRAEARALPRLGIKREVTQACASKNLSGLGEKKENPKKLTFPQVFEAFGKKVALDSQPPRETLACRHSLFFHLQVSTIPVLCSAYLLLHRPYASFGHLRRPSRGSLSPSPCLRYGRLFFSLFFFAGSAASLFCFAAGCFSVFLRRLPLSFSSLLRPGLSCYSCPSSLSPLFILFSVINK